MSVELIDLIRLFLSYQAQSNPDRWYALTEVGHVLVPFGAWDTFDVSRMVSRLIEMGEVEKNTKLRFRWKNSQES